MACSQTRAELTMKYLLILALFLSINALAQIRLPTNETGQVQYQEIVRLAGGKQAARQVAAQARAWAEAQYESEPTTEQQYDQENNIVFIKASQTIDDHNIRYTLTIEAKYGRYRATITDLITDSDGLTLPVRSTSSTASEIEKATGNKVTNKNLIEQTANQQAELYHQIDKICRDTLASLKQAMNELP